MRQDLARVTAANESKLAPQVNLCDSVLSDLDEGVFLAKVILSTPVMLPSLLPSLTVWFYAL